MGCLRTVQEIRSWAKMRPEQQWALVEELKQRKPHKHYS